MENTALTVFLYTLGVVAAIFVIRLLKKPIRLCLRVLAGSLAGGAVLILINSLSLGVNIAVNPFTAIVCGILGAPGIALLISLKTFL